MILAADLFCGAGGTSSGLFRAAEDLGLDVDLTAIDHWDVAIGTHSANHPGARHLCESMDSVDPRKLYPGGRINLLWASPECTHHSRARGGKPCSDQSRASAWHIVRWADALYIDNILIENVPEFVEWGPLGADGKPMPSKKGQAFLAFVSALEALGYRTDWRIINTAHYGDPTARRRFFMQARRGNKKVIWPEFTHTASGGDNLFGETQPFRTAREIIDWNLPGESIFGRKKPLSPRTIERIAYGLKKFGGQAFIVPQQAGRPNELRVKSVDEPLGAITTTGAEALVQPFLVKYYGTGSGCTSINEPLATVTTKERFALVVADGGDIRYRMLQPHELAAAMSFPKGYQFTGNKGEIVKQIGNAVPCETARALCRAILADYAADRIAA